MKAKVGSIIKFHIKRDDHVVHRDQLHNIIPNYFLQTNGRKHVFGWATHIETFDTTAAIELPGTFSQSGNTITRVSGDHTFSSDQDLYVFSTGERAYRLSGSTTSINVSRIHEVAETTLKVFRSGYFAGTHYLTSFPSVTSQDVGYNSITGPTYTNGVVSWTLNNVPLLLDPSVTDYTLRRIGVVNNLYGGYTSGFAWWNFDLPAPLEILSGDVIVIESWEFNLSYEDYQPRALATCPLAGLTTSCVIQRLRRAHDDDDVNPTHIYLLTDANKVTIPDMLGISDPYINPASLTIAETISAVGSKESPSVTNNFTESHSCYGVVATGVVGVKQLLWGTATECFGVIEFDTPQDIPAGKAITVGAATEFYIEVP